MAAVIQQNAYRAAYQGCPLCGGDGEVLRDDPCPPRRKFVGRITWIKCHECAHVHTAEYFTELGRQEVLSSVRQDGIFGGRLDEQRCTWGAVIDRMMPYAGTGRWVDVGVGNGGMLFTMDEYGIEGLGIDLRPVVLDVLRDFGYRVELCDAMNYDYSGTGAVVLSDILEHIPFPKDLLTRIREGLTGALFISCPNMDSVSWRYMDSPYMVANHKMGNPYWNELEHYHNFTRRSLQRLLRECGFTPVDYKPNSRYQAGMEIIAT